MQWSQLKKRVESLFADAVKGRVELHTTAYHKASDLMGRAWLTIDGKEIVNMCSIKAIMAESRETARLMQETGCKDYTNPDQREGIYRAIDQAKANVQEQGIFARFDFHNSLAVYLDLSMNEILASPNPIIKAIGMLDRRFGKRRLASMDAAQEHSLVRRLYSFRCEAEGIGPHSP